MTETSQVRPETRRDAAVRGQPLRAVRLTAALVMAALFAVGCATEKNNPSLLASDDLVLPKDFKFNPNSLVDGPTIADFQAVSADEIQKFFHQTPYKRSSFLETYQSHGIRAVDAILRSASAYRINPIVFIVRAEADQGLVSAPLYPAPPARVEYAFGCGCSSAGVCAAALAGFDVQVDCLAHALRQSLDEIQGPTHRTSGGWAVGKASKTIDGQSVTPADEGTAALYQYAPIVGGAGTGNYLFDVLWQKYATAFNYIGPLGGTSATAWVGDACKKDTDCGFEGATCQTGYPDGFCTAPCGQAECPTSTIHVGTFCASFGGAGSCTAVCDPNVPASCRSGYSCRAVQRAGDTATGANVCVPS